MGKNQPSPDGGRRRVRHNSSDLTIAANGKPQPRPGRQPRRPQPSSAAQDERQTRAFDLHVQGLSCRKIAQALGIDRGTVALDIQMEGYRRAEEFAHLRLAAIEVAVARYETVISRAIIRGEHLRAYAIEMRDGKPVVTSPKALSVANECDRLILQAQSRLDQLRGLHKPSDAPPTLPRSGIAAAFGELPGDLRLQVLKALAERARTLGAHPSRN